MCIFAPEWGMPGLKWILHGNLYWHAEAESVSVRKEHGRCGRGQRISWWGVLAFQGARYEGRPKMVA
jgi:hypothetical protein